MSESKPLGIALSGGGHRATAFGLGALLYLADARLNQNVTTISSVSGGSMLNAFIALQDKAFTEYSPEEFDIRAGRLAQLITGNRSRLILTIRLTLVLLIAFAFLWATLLDTRSVLTTAAILLPTVGLLLGPSSKGFLFSSWCTWLYLVLLIWWVIAIIAWYVEQNAIITWFAVTTSSIWVNPEFKPTPDLVWAIGLLMMIVGLWALLQQRHSIAGLAYGDALACLTGTRRGSKATLEDMQGKDINHVFCATELHAGRHAYFSRKLVYSRGFGLGGPGKLRVRTAVQVSANFPGGFPPRILRASRFKFELADPEELRWKSDFTNIRGRRHTTPRWMVLSDGGVFDNTADAWFLEASERDIRLDVEFRKVLVNELDIWIEQTKEMEGLDDFGITEQYDLPEYHPKFRDPFDRRHQAMLDRLAVIREVPQRLVVINAGKPEPWQSLWSVWIPFFGELTGFSKIASTMYNNSISGKLRDLRIRFLNKTPEGAVVDIEEDPLSRAIEASARQFEGVPKDQVERSRMAYDYLRGDDIKWSEITPEIDFIGKLAVLNTGVATTLAPLGVEITARLLYHAYLQAMVTLHVQFGYPLLYPRPTVNDFVELTNGLPRARRPTAGDKKTKAS